MKDNLRNLGDFCRILNEIVYLKDVFHIDLLSHFTIEKDQFVILKLNDNELDTFLNKLPPNYRKCYVTNERLKGNVETLQMHYGDILKKFYIPDTGKVMSGEFGEILSYFILQEYYLPLKLVGPRKWQWKDDRNNPIQKTDVMLFHKEKEPSSEDLLVSAEIKTKATRNNSYDPIKNAVEGAHNDFVRRLAVSLNWLQAKYAKENRVKSIQYLARFLDPVTYGEYKKNFKAIVVIDDSLIQDEIVRDRDIQEFNADFEIILISIKDLKSCYETTYKNILVSGSDIL